jgi:tetratricopeptide (TPR) repeat protein
MQTTDEQVRQLIRQAEEHMDREEWDEVAELCYQVLALDPDNRNTENKLRLVYLRKDLLREMERQMFRLFDPEDHRPHQRRHKLGFSYACLSPWEGWLELDWEEPPAEVAETLEAGRRRLIADYLMGEERAYAAAQAAFDQALAAADDKAAVLWWLGKIYAHHGYFAEAVEVLEQMAALRPLLPEALRLYGEVHWWRDNDRYICWVL